MTEGQKKKEMNFKDVKIFIRVMAAFLRNLAGIVNKKVFFFCMWRKVVGLGRDNEWPIKS